MTLIRYNLSVQLIKLQSKCCVRRTYYHKYFCIKADIVPDMSQIELTDDEKDGNFHLEYIHKDEVIKKLEDSLETCTRDMPVKDTIQVIKEYLNMNK